MNQEKINHENVHQANSDQRIANETTHAHVQKATEEPLKEKEGEKKKKSPRKKTVRDLDKEIEALKRRRETLYKKQIAELGKQVLAILERNDISFLEISEESDLFFSELEEMIEQNKENLKAIIS
ncbi:hypothetical protein [Enterococcus hirae]|uniref:hypothetical protein n=1 Tax=Enterococcus hirae TaxID=1354 RepID=UPI001A96D22D|nr:hypothetical protein [Enterococcus hirae]MBO1103574.1 hypothetical protein [Enterococcus hirae]